MDSSKWFNFNITFDDVKLEDEQSNLNAVEDVYYHNNEIIEAGTPSTSELKCEADHLQENNAVKKLESENLKISFVFIGCFYLAKGLR